jgi:peptide/nickel transport system permease protein
MTAIQSPTAPSSPPGGPGVERRRRAAHKPGWRQRRGLIAPAIICAVLAFVAVFGGTLAPFGPNVTSGPPMHHPSGNDWFGTDEFGRDVLSRMLVGARTSLIVGVGSVLIGLIVGGAIGLIAGIRVNTWVDALLMRLMDVILSVPVLVLAAVMAGLTGGNGLSLGPWQINQLTAITLIIAVSFVPVFARLGRSSAAAESQEEYVVAARACGVRGWRLAATEVLPNIVSPLVVQAALTVGVAIIAESALSFLGLGVQTPNASWGNILADGQQELLLGGWWLVVFPTIAIAVTVFAFLFIGDRLRDELDPRRPRGLPAEGDLLR